ncbi:diaminopimelate decarboxylase [Colwellia sp. 1_MG-2023]|uniref:diaminopimelate decarboxylase n=1 Tax=unclassified Colwellia TaxID=196834 RepID=UPI001C0A4998|nr:MULTISPECIES: diaminopimelate decarboxylase [unclassified Colwellia]MBU2923151.1 diaminopimelate decarboxylase [Colwellia sp. C2M11]MDO6651420.1 diaminopimelate decarboxylase [Colwellia sp. 3_MG-2023]MDO6664157.1 diaminopimelate decarboxylase [Colwellia sp. 2_MG-2023]MDO6688729.1 diaminopimelate decarboxylase [Colwellia sp. 1_MG-2023]
MKIKPHISYIDNQMHIENVSVESIAKDIPTPFYCYSYSAIKAAYLEYEAAFSDLDTMICYAVKANSNQAILKTLSDLGAGADVVSEGEIRRALSAGIPANKIVFSGVAKTEAEISLALDNDIFQFNVESEPELLLISQIAARKNKSPAISLRVNPNVCAKTHEKITTGKSENKFGIPIAKAREVYRYAASLPNIIVQGVDVHIGSQLIDLVPFEEAFNKVAEFVTVLKADGHKISIIDIGGGLGIDYSEDEIEPDKNAYATIVKHCLSHLDCKIIIEPGRSIVGNAGVLVSSVVYVKKGEERQFLILDAGMNDLVRPSMYDAYHQIKPISNAITETSHYDIVGPVCETGDTFSKNRELPTAKAGDLIGILSCGAYGTVMSSTYNTRLNAPEIMVNDKQFAVIKSRLSYEEVIAQDIIPNWLLK